VKSINCILDSEVSIISGDQCGFWDAPIKLAAIRKAFPDSRIAHFIQDADAVGLPTKDFKNTLEAIGKNYAIAEEGVTANWTSGVIRVPDQKSFREKGEKFHGLVARISDEILVSLDGQAPELYQILTSPQACYQQIESGKGYSSSTKEILNLWLDVMGITGIPIYSVYRHFLDRRDEFLNMAVNWHPEITHAYNSCVQQAGMVQISSSKGELPFFFIFSEGGRLIRKKAYRHKGEWMAYSRNKPRPINIDEVVAIIPRAMLLAVIIRESGYLVLPETGSLYANYSNLLAEALRIKQLPMIRISLKWKDFCRPFVGWIWEEEGQEGLKKVIESATFNVID